MTKLKSLNSNHLAPLLGRYKCTISQY